MAYRHPKTLAAILLFVFTLALIVTAGAAGSTRHSASKHGPFDQVPTGIRPSPSVAQPGQAVTITVTMGGNVTADQVVNVSVSDSSKFTTFPSTVTVPAGLNNVSFTVYIRSDAASTMNLTLAASANGAQATSQMAIMVPPDPIGP